MNITTVLGARPQFIKAAPVSRALRAVHSERLVHTGQHYDPLMSTVFFEELGIPAPDLSLHVGSASHGAQTGRMLEAIEQDLLAHRPDAVLVYGDTNSTLAGALAAAKLGIPLVHVEAGLRSFVRDMPEEINRIVTDRLSTICCCPSASARDQLAREGITEGVQVVGDVMLDALRDTVARVEMEPQRLTALGVTAHDYVLATVHRAANTDDPARLAAIIAAFGALERLVLWPMHPRTRHALAQRNVVMPANVRVVAPLGYLDLVAALSHALVTVTDSGGLQKEAYWLGVPCVTLRNETEWIETVESGWNVLADADTDRIVHAVLRAQTPSVPRDAYGVVGAAQRVVDAISRRL
ncbi:MAG: UDP-N-acetylglucosamine 2-epimerase (non-hydrolyzing) [Gemmatimonas sp.]